MGVVTMSRGELDRVAVIGAVVEHRTSQGEAGRRLGLSVRQVKRLVRRYRDLGAPGLVSGHRGKRPNNAVAEAIRCQALELVRARYPDFGPTLAHEKLTELHGLAFSVETLRKWMVADGVWRPKVQRQSHIHPRRPRRSCLGELVQIDGSPHDWFEGRGPSCTLIVFIDDATSRLMALRFAPAETTQAYMKTLRDYLGIHGRPVAFYSDKHSIFRVNNPDCDGELTQFSRALKTLDIEPIHANTPQAKGRVERANQTLQDRLVKELRLRGISTLEEANAFLPQFMADYNRRFAVAPRSPNDAHRGVLHDEEQLDQILAIHHTRTLSKNLALQFQGGEYQIQHRGQGHRLRGAKVTLCQKLDGSLVILHDGQPLPWRRLAQGEPPIALDDEKSIHHTVDQAKARQTAQPLHKPAPDHPWRKPLPRKPPPQPITP